MAKSSTQRRSYVVYIHATAEDKDQAREIHLALVETIRELKEVEGITQYTMIDNSPDGKIYKDSSWEKD